MDAQMATSDETNGATGERFSTEPLSNLLVPPEELFDEASFDEFLRRQVAESQDASRIRAAALQELKGRRQAGMTRIDQVCRESFPANPFAAL